MNTNEIEIEIVGLSRGCVGCPTPQRVLNGAVDLAALDIPLEWLPEEIEDMVQMACRRCGDSVMCEQVGGCFEISIAKK